MRFTGVAIPQGATITAAWIQFQVDEVSTATTVVTVVGQASDDAAGFTTTTGNLSGRPRTSASVGWTPPAWTVAGARGADQRTPDLSALVQEIVAQGGWVSGNDLVLMISGTGSRVAESVDGGATRAPVLHIEYRT
jgi:hypothetical protein